MAEIPVEKKSNMAWLWLLIALVIAALLLWWVLDDDDEAYVEPAAIETIEADRLIMEGAATNGVTTNSAATGAATGISALIPTIPPAMVGQEVRLTDVQVQDVISDIGFWIGPSPDQRVFAVLSEERTPETAVEGMVDVNPGQTVSLVGTIRDRAQIVAGMAPGSDAGQRLPQGVERFLVVSQVTGANQ